ncbi:hypothetical protein AQ436_12090 [Arthrobacter sp. EpRS66]|nr:hypothetical protein AQ436_12090 [Arthrobacter sp. EpRS66]
MRLFVLDATSIIALEESCKDNLLSLEDVLAKLTNLAINGNLICPRLAIDQCKKLGPADRGTTWVRGVSGHFSTQEESWEYYEQVLDTCDQMVDPDDLDENPQVGVLAAALKHRDSGREVVVVTEQKVDTPLQMSQATAAQLLHIDTQSVETFLMQLPADTHN